MRSSSLTNVLWLLKRNSWSHYSRIKIIKELVFLSAYEEKKERKEELSVRLFLHSSHLYVPQTSVISFHSWVLTTLFLELPFSSPPLCNWTSGLCKGYIYQNSVVKIHFIVLCNIYIRCHFDEFFQTSIVQFSDTVYKHALKKIYYLAKQFFM